MADCTRPDLHDLAAIYALDGLDVGEATEFETHIDGCDHCLAIMDEFVDAAAKLAGSCETAPPAEMKSRVMNLVMTTRQDSPVVAAVVDLAGERERRRPRALIATAIAASLALIIGVTALVVSERSAEPTIDIAAVLVAPDVQVIPLGGDAAGSVSVAWSEARGQFVLLADDLPQIDDELTYELWFIGEGDPIKAALFDHNEGNPIEIAGELEGPPSVWAVTIEPAGGTDAPTTAPLYAAEVGVTT